MWKSFTDWLHAPFTTPLDPEHLFIAVGVIIVSVIAWGIILRHVTRGVEAVA